MVLIHGVFFSGKFTKSSVMNYFKKNKKESKRNKHVFACVFVKMNFSLLFVLHSDVTFVPLVLQSCFSCHNCVALVSLVALILLVFDTCVVN